MENRAVAAITTARKKLSWIKDVSIAILTIVSIVILFADYIFPLTQVQRGRTSTPLTSWLLLFLRSIIHIGSTMHQKEWDLSQSDFWYEIPATLPLFITGSLWYLRFIVFFRLGRLYNMLSMIRGSKMILLANLWLITIVFGALGVYLSESSHPNANIHTRHDAKWWSIKTITTVT